MHLEARMPALEKLIENYRPTHEAYLSILVILILVSAFAWMFLSELDEVAVAKGCLLYTSPSPRD